VAEALLAEDEPAPQNGPGLVRARGLVRPRLARWCWLVGSSIIFCVTEGGAGRAGRAVACSSVALSMRGLRQRNQVDVVGNMLRQEQIELRAVVHVVNYCLAVGSPQLEQVGQVDDALDITDHAVEHVLARRLTWNLLDKVNR
jgi:hypothetical protein